MIKSTELMIGDYVLVDGKPRRVESITKKKIGYHINPQTDKRLYYARLHDVEPIVITNLLLQKTFEPGATPNHFQLQVGICDIVLCLKTMGYCFVRVEDAIFESSPYIDMWIKDIG